MNIKSIKTLKDNQNALTRIEQIWEAEPNTPEDDELGVLVTLVEKFEEEHFPIEAPDLNAAIKFIAEQGFPSKNQTVVVK